MQIFRYDGDVKAEIKIREYTGWDERNRVKLVREIAEKHKDDEAMLVDGILGYAPCVSCSSGEIVLADGTLIQPSDLTLDGYLGLPANLCRQWLEAVLQVNPSWKPDFSADVDEKKT